MLTVTDSALVNMAEALGRIEDRVSDDACFRIVSTDDGRLTLTLDAPASDDTAFEHDGTTVLVVSEELRERCDSRTLESDQTGNLLLT